MPKISIVIPAYNVGDYLQECLDSVRNQTFSDIEAIVVNDASPDNVGEVAAQAAAQDARIRVVTNNPNMGTHRTRMAGVENASGEYTFFLDAMMPSSLICANSSPRRSTSIPWTYCISVLPLSQPMTFWKTNAKPSKPSTTLPRPIPLEKISSATFSMKREATRSIGA